MGGINLSTKSDRGANLKWFSIIRRMVYFPLVAVAAFGLLASIGVAATRLTGSIATTNSSGTIVNQNHFALKEAVFLSGGPQNTSGPQLPPGTYYFQVTDPSGNVLLSTDDAVCRQVIVDASGKIVGVPVGNPCEHVLGGNPIPGAGSPNGTVPVQLFPFSDSPNGGVVYKVSLVAQSSAVAGCNPTANGKHVSFTGDCAKSDNFQVDFQSVPACSAWHDDFNTGTLDATRWTVGTGRAPGNSATNNSTVSPGNVSLVGGLLTLKLDQEVDHVDPLLGKVWNSTGAVIYTSVPCGYGTYEWTMRATSSTNGPSSTGVNVSGGVSSGFIYVHNSETEINFEYSALSPATIYFINFWNRDPDHRDALDSEGTGTPYLLPDVISDFHNYKFVWEPGIITFYVDNHKVAVHNSLVNPHASNFDPNVPSAPAFFEILTFGRDFPFWGGPATAGIRYFFVKHAGYTPPM